MRNPFSRGDANRPRRREEPWNRTSRRARDGELTAEQEQALEHDDLAELLAATNAKRAARGKAHLSSDDVEMRLWQQEQEVRRQGWEQIEPDPLDDWEQSRLQERRRED